MGIVGGIDGIEPFLQLGDLMKAGDICFSVADTSGLLADLGLVEVDWGAGCHGIRCQA